VTSGWRLFPVYAASYAGYKATERPLHFESDDEIYEIASIEDRYL